MMKKMMKLFVLAFVAFLSCAAGLLGSTRADAANPYLPHWEHIPDGEPKLFEDPDNPGKYRVYIYGSHDTRKTEYCGYDLVTWSAPAENLNDWRYEGVIFTCEIGETPDVFYAPDVAEKIDPTTGKKEYYLYPNNRSAGREDMIAKSDSPKGPFEVCNWKEGSTTETEGILGYDAAFFVDDDGRAYGYWGFEASSMAELDPETMCTLKEGCEVLTEKETGIDSCKGGDTFRFFEASSIRKVEDKYVFVYSRTTNNGEGGLGPSNCTLAYAYSDTPLGPWTYGGTIIDARARETDQNGNVIGTMTQWNTHGSILEVNGQWYVFYHRCIDNSQYCRQGVVEAIDVKVTEDGKVEITEAEVTSQGFEINGLNPYKKVSAGSACWVTGGARIGSHYEQSNPGSNVTRIGNGSIIGYKYLNFDLGRGTRTKDVLSVCINNPDGREGTFNIMLDRPWESDGGTKIASFDFTVSDIGENIIKTVPIENLSSITGKHALYFVLNSDRSSNVCELVAFQFGDDTVTDADEGQDPEPMIPETPTPAPGEPPATTNSPAPGQTQTPAPSVSASPAPTQTPEPTPDIDTQKSYTVGGLVYEITKADTSGKGTVTVKKAAKKTSKSVKIPDTITIQGVKYRVTAIGASAFKGCKKLKTVNIKATGLKKVGKNAFKGIHAKAKITVPKKKLSKYKKMLKSAQGIKKTMKVKGK